MSQENLELVRASYAAFAEGGLDGYMEHFADDVDYRAVEDAPDDRGPIHGKDALRAWLQDWIDMFDSFTMEPMELIETGDDMVVCAERYGGRARLSSVATDSSVWTVFTIRTGKIARAREYPTRAEALEAVGLRE